MGRLLIAASDTTHQRPVGQTRDRTGSDRDSGGCGRLPVASISMQTTPRAMVAAQAAQGS